MDAYRALTIIGPVVGLIGAVALLVISWIERPWRKR
jgi:hypothetical protein